MQYLGDILEDATIRGSFNTRTAAGTPITLGGTPALSVYKDANASQTTAGVTLTVDFDALTGHHIFTINTSADAFYATGSDYRVVITTGTVDGTSVVGTEVASFSIENRNTKANVTQMAANVITASALATDAVTEIQTGLATALQVEQFVAASELNLESLLVDIPTVAEFEARTLPSADYFVVSDYTAPPSAATIADAVWDELQTGHTSVGSFGYYLDSKVSTVGGGTPPTASAIADAVWDEVLAGHLTAGTTGAALNASGGAGDPWSTTLPGAYTASQAGSLLADIFDKTAIITTGNVTVTAPVSEAGVITELILGDDYLAANGRALTWSVTEISGVLLANASCKFWMRKDDVTDSWTGTVSDGTDPKWTLSVDIANTDWGTLEAGLYEYGVEIIDSSNSREVTVVINPKDQRLRLRSKV
jgi:hypothetical protein